MAVVSGARLVLISLMAAGATAQCADEKHSMSTCASSKYTSEDASSSDDCCALCASDSKCKQWTYDSNRGRCDLTAEPDEISGLHFFSTCGIKAAPTPPPAPPVPPAPPTPPVPGTNKWAVIAAGSAGFGNYRHQADACHAYQQVLKSGVPAENIILMMQDDVANNRENPFPGKLYNKPGADSVDVYDGCKIDYRGSVVTAKLFLSVITGDSSGVPDGGKVLKSTSKDRVFLNFVDHGGVGIIAFPNGPTLHAKDLVAALKTMQQKQMYNELLFYMEACESGSMFPGLPTDSKIFAVTAANAKESSWGYYCPSNDTVHGKHIGSCLGDLFSIAWMEDSDLGAYQSESIKDQVQRVTARTSKSHVSTFGDTSFESQPFGNFELRAQVEATSPPAASTEGAVESREIPLVLAQYKYDAAKSASEKEEAAKKLQAVIAARKADEDVFGSIAHKVCEKAGYGCVEQLQQARFELMDTRCHQELVNKVHEACPRRAEENPGGWNDYNMKFSQLLVNVCESRGKFGNDVARLTKLVEKECAVATASVTSVEIAI